MKRLTIPLACFSLLTLSPLAPSPALADANPNPDVGALGVCQYVTGINGDKLGSCVGFQSLNFRDNYDGLTSHLCYYVQSHEPDIFYQYYDSFEECVTDGASALFALG
jgi:hypothetical protein